MHTGDQVLLIEYEPAVRSVIRAILSTNNISMVEAVSGAAALEYLVENHVRLILLDTMIPDMDIGDLLIGIKQCCLTPVVLLATGAQQYDVPRSKSIGVILVLNKPFTIDEFWDNVAPFLL